MLTNTRLGTVAVMGLTISIFIGTSRARCESVATYELLFTKLWWADSHPTNYPANAHFSGLGGVTHNANVSFWNPGELATQGIKDIAELGSKTAFIAEANSAISAGTADSVLSYLGISGSETSRTAGFQIRESFPLVTIVSMLAPSPDWFVGISSYELRAGSDWVSSAHFELFPWDAGTDDGVSFTSANKAATPPQPISLLDTFPFAGTGPVASLDLRLVSQTVYPAGDFDGDGDVDGRDFLAWQRTPNIGNLADWQAAYGGGTVSDIHAVPEPSCLVILCFGTLANFAWRGCKDYSRCGQK